MPEHLVSNGAWLVLQLLHHGLHSQQIFCLRPVLVHSGNKMSRAYVVKIIVKDIVSRDVSILCYHLVGIHLTIFQNVIASITQIRIEHTL